MVKFFVWFFMVYGIVFLATTPSVINYKQILLFRFIQLMMYVVYNMKHIHH